MKRVTGFPETAVVGPGRRAPTRPALSSCIAADLRLVGKACRRCCRRHGDDMVPVRILLPGRGVPSRAHPGVTVSSDRNRTRGAGGEVVASGRRFFLLLTGHGRIQWQKASSKTAPDPAVRAFLEGDTHAPASTPAARADRGGGVEGSSRSSYGQEKKDSPPRRSREARPAMTMCLGANRDSPRVSCERDPPPLQGERAARQGSTPRPPRPKPSEGLVGPICVVRRRFHSGGAARAAASSSRRPRQKRSDRPIYRSA